MDELPITSEKLWFSSTTRNTWSITGREALTGIPCSGAPMPLAPEWPPQASINPLNSRHVKYPILRIQRDLASEWGDITEFDATRVWLCGLVPGLKICFLKGANPRPAIAILASKYLPQELTGNLHVDHTHTFLTLDF